MDGHGSHLNLKFLNWCEEHKVLRVVYPPHSTHRLQPLDVSDFAPLANAYSQELDRSLRHSEGRTAISKRHFFCLFWAAFEKAFTEKNVASAWSKTGIWPFSPQKVLRSFPMVQEATPETRRSRKRSTDSPPSICDSQSKAKKLRTTLKATSVGSDKRTQKTLSDTVSGLSAKLVLSKLKVKHLNEAQGVEEKKLERKKKIADEMTASDGSGTLFMSPSEIQKARDIVSGRE